MNVPFHPKKHYLAGPMTGLPLHNWPVFEATCISLRSKGFLIISPHELNEGEQHKEHTPERRLHCMRVDLHALIDCDAILLLPGWQKSQGATFEFEVARRLGLEIHFL
jgi:nucleoside 2-deoxyribosyltransferase